MIGWIRTALLLLLWPGLAEGQILTGPQAAEVARARTENIIPGVVSGQLPVSGRMAGPGPGATAGVPGEAMAATQWVGPADAGQGRGGARDVAGSARGLDSIPEPGPIELLLALSDSLGLTPHQVRELEALNAELDRRNAELVAQLMEIRREVQELDSSPPRRMRARRGQVLEVHTQRAMPLVQRIQANNCAAMERVGRILTPDQRDWLRTWLQVQPGAQRDTLAPGRAGTRGFGAGLCPGGPGGSGRVR